MSKITPRLIDAQTANIMREMDERISVYHPDAVEASIRFLVSKIATLQLHAAEARGIDPQTVVERYLETKL